MNRPISELMTREVHAIGMEDTTARVEGLFAEHRLSWAPVLDEDRTVIGVLSSADLLRHRVEGRDIETTPAWRLCTYKPLQVRTDTPAREVARLMAERRIHHVVVEGPHGIAGVVSAFDFVKAIAAS
jgi:CBS-domain-containing membrane protein